MTSLARALIILLLLNAAACTGSAQEEGTTTILDIVGDNENFVIIAGAFNNSSLNTVLTGNESHTVFLPTDQAFENMSEGTLEELTADPAALEQVLLYHVTNGTLMAEDLTNVSNVTTLQGSQLPVNATEEGIFVGDAEVIQADITADNGVVHIIDTVLIPPGSPFEENDIIETATQEGNFTTLLLALGAANLTEDLKGEGPFTLFAPTDEAFNALPNGTIEALLNDTGTLTGILHYHMTDGRLMAEDIANMTNITTHTGAELPVNITEEGIFIGDAQVVMQDINASNGVIHAIDAVLIPEEAVEGPIELYNDTVNLTAGNFTFTPENRTQNFTADNFTDIGALNATGLDFNVSVEGVNLTNMTNTSVLEEIEGIRNNNETGEMWFVYINGTQAEEDFGMNPVTNGTNLSFWYTNEENEEAAIGNATYVANITVFIEEEPSGEGDIIETATQDGNFTTLLLALEAANLTDTLREEGPFTVFAPTDEAFNALPNGTIEPLLNDTDALTSILLYHVAEERLMAEDIVNITNITTLQGSELPVNVTEEGVFVGNAQVIVQDVNASNGVIHAIDAVLIPEEGIEPGQNVTENLTVLYNDTVNLTAGNFTFTPENRTQNFTADNFTDIGALNATGLQYNVSVEGVNLTNMTNTSVLEEIEGIRNNNETGEMWFVYINGTQAEEDFGMNPVTDGDNLSFWYTTEENGEAQIGNATYVANITVAIEEGIEPEPGQNVTELYNDSVSLTQGNFTLVPENSTQNYRINNFTDIGALNATGLDFNVSVMQGMAGNATNLTSVPFILQSIEGIENDNETGEMWFIYINGEPAEESFGMNEVSAGDNLSFLYAAGENGEAEIENATHMVNITVAELRATANIIPAAQNETNLTIFVNSVQAANLTQDLNETGPYTVCIPSNEAFNKLPAETRNELMNNTTQLRDVLSYHVISGRYAREQLISMNNVTNIQGNVLQINTIGNNITIQNVNVTQIIIVNNGVICIIDEVLIPPDSQIPADNQTNGNQTNGNQTDGNQTGNQTAGNLTGDWYFFSIPFEANNTSVDNLLSGVNYTSLIYYNASTKLFENVSDIEPLKAYWINVPNGTEFNASEQFDSVEKKQITAPPSLQVYPGWNALGSPVNETVPAEAAFITLNNSSLNSSYAKIVGPWIPGNNTTGYYQYVGYNGLNGTIGENQLGADEFEVEPYEGYWVFIKQENLYG